MRIMKNYEKKTKKTNTQEKTKRNSIFYLWNNKWLWIIMLFAAAILFSFLRPIQLDEGGEVTFFSMLAIVLIGYFFGVKDALLSAVAFGLLTFWMNYPFVNNTAEFCDYLFGYGILGIGGIVAWKSKKLRLGYAVAVILRYIESIINCVMFYYIPTDTLWENIWEGISYSFVYVCIEGFITYIALMIPSVLEAIEYWKVVATSDKKENLDSY